MIKDVLAGQSGAAERIVLANAAAALLAADKATSLPEAVERARASIRSGAAQGVLETLRRLSAP
jgi:anthranilate phosphoribosyltransferase